MVRGYIFVFIFAITISIGSFSPAPLDDLNIYFNLNEPTKGKRYGQNLYPPGKLNDYEQDADDVKDTNIDNLEMFNGGRQTDVVIPNIPELQDQQETTPMPMKKLTPQFFSSSKNNRRNKKGLGRVECPEVTVSKADYAESNGDYSVSLEWSVAWAEERPVYKHKTKDRFIFWLAEGLGWSIGKKDYLTTGSHFHKSGLDTPEPWQGAWEEGVKVECRGKTGDPCAETFAVVGPCEAAFQIWSYNQSTGKCEDFIYGGCEGNNNRFDSEKECELACGTTQRPVKPPPAYLDVPGFQECLGNKSSGSYSVWCFPLEKPAICDATSWERLMTLQNDPKQHLSSCDKLPVTTEPPMTPPDLNKCHTTSKPAISDAQKRAMIALDVGAVKRDIKKLLTDSQEFWPADYGNYGPLFVRQAWHSAGTYRLSDGRGGVDGGRQRFDPEASWEDNKNLDKARKVLEIIKKKYGEGLSFGDLYVLAGNVAIESMGGPILGFCGGRIDDVDGSESILLGPSPEQRKLFPCEEEGNCHLPLGTGQMELIYVNPEGPQGNPDPVASAKNIRDIFGRMGLNDSETVALIGGGHAFGKVHGPCIPKNRRRMHLVPKTKDPSCLAGKGIHAYTSGFEFPWTSEPTKWDNEFFQNLVKYEFEKSKGPGDKWEWKATGNKRPQAPAADGNGTQDTGMLTADVALKHDKKYWDFVQKWAKDQASFDHDFKYAWYKLTTRDMGLRSRCIGNDIPAALPWQYPLPDSSSLDSESAIDSVKTDLKEFLESEGHDLQGLFIRLAWQCSATYRATDFQGGCNGARIRFSPQKDWPENDGLNEAIGKLQFIKDKYRDELSWADLIILAGYEAINEAGGLDMKFCPGRSDATNEDGMSKNLKTTGHMFKDLCMFVDLMDLTNKEYSVLHAAAYAIGQKLPRDLRARGLFGRRDGSQTDGKLSNIFFKRIISPYKAEVGNDMIELDMLFTVNEDLNNIAQIYANNNELFLADFSAAWTKVSNMGSFDGPFGSMCDSKGRFQ